MSDLIVGNDIIQVLNNNVTNGLPWGKETENKIQFQSFRRKKSFQGTIYGFSETSDALPEIGFNKQHSQFWRDLIKMLSKLYNSLEYCARNKPNRVIYITCGCNINTLFFFVCLLFFSFLFCFVLFFVLFSINEWSYIRQLMQCF